MPTLAQKRAADAYNKVYAIAHQSEFEGIRKNYGSLARSISSMIQINGLGPTLAFLKAKAEGNSQKPSMILYGHFNSWLISQIRDSTQNPADFLHWITNQNSTAYHKATIEALEYGNWIKRFAEAEGLSGDDSGEI